MEGLEVSRSRPMIEGGPAMEHAVVLDQQQLLRQELEHGLIGRVLEPPQQIRVSAIEPAHLLEGQIDRKILVAEGHGGHGALGIAAQDGRGPREVISSDRIELPERHRGPAEPSEILGRLALEVRATR
jgi:hypothetical protein